MFDNIDIKLIASLISRDIEAATSLMLDINRDWIMDTRAANVFKIIEELNREGHRCSIDGLKTRYSNHEFLDSIREYITHDMSDHELIDALKHRFIRQHVLNGVQEIKHKIEHDPAYGIDRIHSDVEFLNHPSLYDNGNAPILIKDMMAGYCDSVIYEAYNDKEIGVHPYLNGLQSMIGSFRPPQLVVIAGRPSMGKSLLALEIMAYNAIEASKSGIFYSLEMSKEVVCDRLLSRYCDLDLKQLSARELTDADIKKIYQPVTCNDCGSNNIAFDIFKPAEGLIKHKCLSCGSDNVNTTVDIIQNMSLIINDNGGMTVNKIVQNTRYLKTKYPDISFITIDYLGLMKLDPNLSKNDAIDSICVALRNLAKELNIIVFLISQLNREVEKRQNKRPMMSDLRDSGAIEQSADSIIFVHRDFIYTGKEEDRYHGDIILAKQRNGPTGKIAVKVDASRQRMWD